MARENRRPSHFLGFTHFCGQRHQRQRPSSSGGLRRRSEWLRSSKPSRLSFNAGSIIVRAEVGAWLRKVVLGYYQYHAVPGNSTQLRIFRRRIGSAVAERSGSSQSARTGAVGSSLPGLRRGGFLNPAFCIPILMHASRHSSTVRAVCVNALVRICAGGDSAMVVPTATFDIHPSEHKLPDFRRLEN